MTSRREFLLLLAGLLVLPAAPALAKGGSGGGGGGGHGGGDDGGGDDGGDDDGGDDGGGDDDGGDDKDRRNGKAGKAREAVKKGKAASLREVLGLVRRRYPGRILRVDADDAGGGLVYQIRLIDERNRRMDIRVDASLRRIVSAEFK